MSNEDFFSVGLVLVMTVVVVFVARRSTRGKSAAERQARAQWLLPRRWPLGLLGGGALIALTGVGMVVHASLIHVTEVDLMAVEDGASLDGSYVRVTGFARPEAGFCRRGRWGGESCYTPITSARDSHHVAVLLADRADAAASPQTWEGFTTRSNLSSFRRDVEETGLEPTDDLARVIPESRSQRSTAGSFVAFGGLALLLVGCGWLRRMPAD